MKVYLCALAKNEHLYINEWVSHYLKLGFDKIFIFDNDNKDSPNIKDFIDNDKLAKCRVINARGIHESNMQTLFYNNFYRLEKNNFNWCLFCDIDEFLVGVGNIKLFLQQPKFAFANQIRVKWQMYDDNGLIERDMSKGVMETFTHKANFTLTRDLTKECGMGNQGKAFVRGGLNNVYFNSVHFATNRMNDVILNSVLPNGQRCLSGVEIKEKYTTINVFLNHYMTKSLSEFITQKINRGDAVFGNRKIDFNYYWRINEKTQDKLDYIKNLGLEL